MPDAGTNIAQSLQSVIETTCENLRVMPWRQIWAQKAPFIAAFALFLSFLVLIMIFRDRISRKRRAVQALAYVSLLISFVFVGLILKAQPTTTNIVIFLAGLKEGTIPIALVIMEPFIFLSFLFIGVTVLLWGRGVFCGWLCPYGAMVELLNRIFFRFFPRHGWSLPVPVHNKLVYLKYVFLAAIERAFCRRARRHLSSRSRP